MIKKLHVKVAMLEISNQLTLCVRRSRKVDNAELPRPTAGEKTRQKKHQHVSEGISWEPRIVSSHAAPQKIAKKISFQMTENDMMVALQV